MEYPVMTDEQKASVLLCLTNRAALEVTPKLREEGAPRHIIEAGTMIDDYVRLGLTPPKDVLSMVERWLARERGNNRYGR